MLLLQIITQNEWLKWLFYAIVFAFFFIWLKLLRKGAMETTALDMAQKARVIQRTFVGITIWLLIAAIVTFFGVFQVYDRVPPNIAFIPLSALLIIILWLSQKSNRKAAMAIPVSWLFFFHILRIPVELWIWQMHEHQYLPEIMTFSGWNVDLYSGILLPITGYLVFSKKVLPRWFAWLANALGSLTLLWIVGLAIGSLPGKVQFLSVEIENAVVGTFPFIWLPAFIVPLVLLAHIITFMQLARKKPA